MCWMPDEHASTRGAARHPQDLIERRTDAGFSTSAKMADPRGKTVLTPAWRPCTTWNWADTLFPVKAGTILIDASLCEEETSTGRLRFTEATNCPTGSCTRGLYTGAPGRAPGAAACRQETRMEIRRICLGPPCSCPCQWSSGVSTKCGPVRDNQAIVQAMSR